MNASLDYIALAKASAPEILMTVLGLFVAVLDAAWLKRWDAARRAKWLGLITVLGLIAVLGVLQNQFAAALLLDGPIYADAHRIVVLDGLAVAIKAVIVVLTIATVFISLCYEFTRHVGEYFCLVLFATIGMSIVVATENLLMFFVALELLSICLYALTAFHKGLLRSAEASVKYFLFGAFSSAFLLFGLSYLVGLTGALHLGQMAVALKTQLAQTGTPSMLLLLGLLFFLVGVGFKIAVVPFHLWAPDTYEGAPTPVAAFIATGSKLASFVVGGKILLIGLGGLAGSAMISWTDLIAGRWAQSCGFSAGWVMVLALLAAASMIWGNVAAISQRNAKRLLAYSSIAHAGYLLLGLIAVNETGLTALLFYLVVYGITNLGAFGVIAALTRAAGGDDIEDLNGMAQRAPFLSLMLLIFVLSLAGIPPLAGFFGKFYLFAAAVKADAQNLGLLWLVAIGIATSAVSLYYYLILLKHVYVLPPRLHETVSVSGYWCSPLGALTFAVLALGVYPQPLVELFQDLAHSSGVLGALMQQ